MTVLNQMIFISVVAVLYWLIAESLINLFLQGIQITAIGIVQHQQDIVFCNLEGNCPSVVFSITGVVWQHL